MKPGLALVHCDPYVDGEPWPYSPRVILRRLLERAADADQGLSLSVGAKIEYLLVNRDEHGVLSAADTKDTAAQPCYYARGLTRMYDHLTVSSAMTDRCGGTA